VYQALVETMHPHHVAFKKRVQNMTRAIAMGQRIRGAPSTFLPGRMAYEFDTGDSAGSSDIPRTIFASKEDAPKVDNSRRAAPVLPDTITLVRDTLANIVEQRKQRKREKAAGVVGETGYSVARKVVSIAKPKAKDADDDIFGGVGKFDPTEVARAARQAQKSSSQPRAAKDSYFADAGAEKYLRAPKGQLDMDQIETEDKDRPGGGAEPAADEAKVEFEAADRFMGPRPGWAFKTGKQGLGYYREASASAGGAASSSAGAKKRKRTGAAAATPAATDDAYGECFPESGLGHAAVDTGEGDSDEEGEDVKKKIERLKKLAGKSDAPDSMAANRKDGVQKGKKKMTEGQQWQKIDHMIKHGKHGSLEALEAQASSKRRAMTPREIMSTPIHF